MAISSPLQTTEITAAVRTAQSSEPLSTHQPRPKPDPDRPTSNIPSSAKSPPVAPRSIPAQARSGARGVTSPRSNFGSLDSKLSNSFGERFNHFEQLAELESEDMTLDKGDDEVEEMLFNVHESVPPPKMKSGPLIAYSRVDLLRWSKSKLCQMPKDMPGFDLWYGEMSAKSPTSASRDGRQGGNGGTPRSAPGTSAADIGNDSEGVGFGRGFGFGLGRGQASSGRPRQAGFRRPDVSPTAVKSPVDTDGHHSYFSNKMKEGQEPLESGDGMQMGRFVKKSGLRLGGDELNRPYQSEPRTRGPHTPRGGREGGHYSEGREPREKPNSEVAGGWRKGAALTGGVAPVSDRHERERDRKWNPPTSQGHRDRDGTRGGADDRVPEWMADDSAPPPMSSKRRGEADDALEPERSQRKSGLAGLQIGVDAIAQYKMQMKEKEMRSKGLLDRDDGESRPGMTDQMPLSDPAIQSQFANARQGDPSTSGIGGSSSFLLPAPKGRSSVEPTGNSGSGGRGSRFAKFFDGGPPAPPPGLAHHTESNISYESSNLAISPSPIDAHKQGLAALLSMGVDVKVPSGIAASAPYAVRPTQQRDMPAPSAQVPLHINGPPPGLPMSQMLAPPSQGGDGRSSGQKNGGTQPDEHMSRLLGMLKVASPSATPSPQPPNAVAMPKEQERHSQDLMSTADRPQSQHSQPMYGGRQALQASGPPGLGPQGPSRMQASYQSQPSPPQQQGSPIHSRQPSQTPQPQPQAHQQGPDPRFMPPGMMAPHSGFPEMHPNSQNGMNAAAFQQQMLMRHMAAAGFNPAQSPPGPPGMQGMPFHFGPGPGGLPPQGQPPYPPMPPHNMPPQFGQPPFGMIPPQFRDGPRPPPGMGGQHPQPDLMAMLLQGGQR